MISLDDTLNTEQEKHIVAFIDLLGFKASLNADSYKKFLPLLEKFHSTSGNCNRDLHQPAITVFSDSVVMSYQVLNDKDVIVAMTILSKIISSLADFALNYDFLIRGGISIGQMYHKDGIVVGNALIEAYKLENELAVYPRVILSADLCNLIDNKLQDFDGLFILNYIQHMLFAGEYLPLNQRIKNNYVRHEEIIAKNINDYKNSHKIFSKWKWFEQHYKIRKEYTLSLSGFSI